MKTYNGISWMVMPRNVRNAKCDDKELASQVPQISTPYTKLGAFLRVVTLFRKKAEDLATTLEDLTDEEQDLFEMPVLYCIPYREYLEIFKNNYKYIIERDRELSN